MPVTICPFCRQQVNLVEGPDGGSICPLCQNQGQAASTELGPAPEAPSTGKSPLGAALRTWIIPGWGQGYVQGTARGWLWFFASVTILAIALIVSLMGGRGIGWLVLAFDTWAIIHAGRAAAAWNRAHNAPAPKSSTGITAVVLLVTFLILIFTVTSAR